MLRYARGYDGRANLRNANLNSANLIDSNLDNANIENASIMEVIGNRKQVKNISIFEDYHIAYTISIIQIGYKDNLIEDWRNMSNEDLFDIEDEEEFSEFWSKNKELILNIVDSHPAIK